MEKFVTTKEGAELKGVHPRAVARWCAEGWIPCHKMGGTWLVEREGLEAFEPPPPGRKPKWREEEGEK